MLEEERALLHILREEPPALPAWAWERVQARLHEPARPRERLNVWLWCHRRLVANVRWAAVAAVAVLALWTWTATPTLQPTNQPADNLSGYAEALSYAQSTVVDDPLTERTQVILSGW